MVDAGFPGRHTTTTQVTQTQVSPEIRYDQSYIRTIPGILKIACIVFNLLGFICIQLSGPYSYIARGKSFDFVAMIGFWFTAIMLVFYLFHICEKFYKIPWLQIEMYFNAVWAILFLIVSLFAATYPVTSYTVAAFFGFCSMCIYGYDAFLKYQSVRVGEIAQGMRVVEQRRTTIVA